MSLLVPETELGNYSVRFMVAFAIFLFIFNIFVLSGQTGGENYFDNLYLSIPFSLAVICGIASFITGLISIFHRERCIFVFLSVLISLSAILFVIGEIVYPH